MWAKTAERLHEIAFILMQTYWMSQKSLLIDRFGRLGYELYRKAASIHNSPVKSDRIRKSIGKETYGKILQVEEDIKKS